MQANDMGMQRLDKLQNLPKSSNSFRHRHWSRELETWSNSNSDKYCGNISCKSYIILRNCKTTFTSQRISEHVMPWRWRNRLHNSSREIILNVCFYKMKPYYSTKRCVESALLARTAVIRKKRNVGRRRQWSVQCDARGAQRLLTSACGFFKDLQKRRRLHL